MLRPSAIVLSGLFFAAGCADEAQSPSEPFYPRNLLIEVEAQSGVSYLHTTGMGDGSLRIFQIAAAGATPALKLVQKFAAENNIFSSEAFSFTSTQGLDGAWGLALSPSGEDLFVGGLWANELVHFQRPDPLSWAWAGSVRDGDPVRADLLREADGLYGVKDIAITADAKYLYTAGSKDDGIGIYILKNGNPIFESLVSGIDGAFEIFVSTTTTSTSSVPNVSGAEYLLYVLGARRAASPHTLCQTGGFSELTVIRHRAGGAIEVLQRIQGGFADELCAGAENGPEGNVCLADRLAVAAMRGATDLEFTRDTSGTEYLLVSAQCDNTVVRFERLASGLLAARGTHTIPAPWPASEDTAAPCGSTDDDRDGIQDGCDLGLTAVLAKNDVIYAFSGDGGFVDVFGAACFTTTSTPACADAPVCIDVTDGDCKVFPGADRLGSHPFEAVFDGDVIYVSLDQESAVGVLDVGADGTPKLREIFDAR